MTSKSAKPPPRPARWRCPSAYPAPRSSGALLVVRAELAVGDVASLLLHVTGDPSSRTRATHARVVRIEPLEPDERALWSHRVAVQFDEPLTDFEPEIRALEAWQRQLGQRL